MRVQQGITDDLATPLLREGVPIGTIPIRRTEVRPFTDKQIALLKTFADQAVIAIENVRLFKELQERNAELRRLWSIRRRRAEVLGHHQPLADGHAAGAGRHRRERGAGLCDANDVVHATRVDGNAMDPRAHFGSDAHPAGRDEISIDRATYFAGCASTANASHSRCPAQQRMIFQRLQLGTRVTHYLGHRPSSARGNSLGRCLFAASRCAPSPRQQIKLLETFADQAVIAIENVRLFQRTQGVTGTADSDERILGRNRQLADGHSAGAGCGRRECGAAV